MCQAVTIVTHDVTNCVTSSLPSRLAIKLMSEAILLMDFRKRAPNCSDVASLKALDRLPL